MMAATRSRRCRWPACLVVGVAAATVAGGCTWQPHQPQVTTAAGATAATTTAPATTTTTMGHDPAHGEHGDHGQGDDKGWSQLFNGHQHDSGEVPLDAATQAELDRQLALTKPLMEKYPTVAAAVADGYRRGSPFAPGMGTHFVRLGDGPPPGSAPPSGPSGSIPPSGPPGSGSALVGSGPITDEQVARPILIFNGNEPDDPLVGFMYMQMSSGDHVEPEGFAGPNDHWHYHTNLCVVLGEEGINLPFGSDQDITREQCDGASGRLLPITGYMLHVWNVPGWENPGGVFAELHPAITCKDGTYHIIPLDQVGTNSTVCLDEAVID